MNQNYIEFHGPFVKILMPDLHSEHKLGVIYGGDIIGERIGQIGRLGGGFDDDFVYGVADGGVEGGEEYDDDGYGQKSSEQSTVLWLIFIPKHLSCVKKVSFVDKVLQSLQQLHLKSISKQKVMYL